MEYQNWLLLFRSIFSSMRHNPCSCVTLQAVVTLSSIINSHPPATAPHPHIQEAMDLQVEVGKDQIIILFKLHQLPRVGQQGAVGRIGHLQQKQVGPRPKGPPPRYRPLLCSHTIRVSSITIPCRPVTRNQASGASFLFKDGNSSLWQSLSFYQRTTNSFGT